MRSFVFIGVFKVIDVVFLSLFWKRSRASIALLFCALLPLTAVCQKDCLFFAGVPSNDSLIHDQPGSEGVSNALAKARLVAGIDWMPLDNMPSVYDSPYFAGENRLGLPYSLAQKSNGYVGLDVTFYTFMTALHNPRSVLYTENLALPPYNGFDAAPYYGSVCSTSVWYVLGVKAPYYTYSIGQNKALIKREELPADSIQLCDVLWNSGHVALVYDIGRDVCDSIKKVVVFETTRRLKHDSKLVEYSFEGFQNRWDNNGWVIYRPKDLSNNPAAEEPFCWLNGHLIPQFSYNEDLCTNRGDKVAYAVGDTVVINVFSEDYPELELFKDGELYQVKIVDGDDIVFRNLPYGSYMARLINGDRTSEYISFEMIDINVSYTIGDKLTVYFSSANAVPEFMSLGDIRECPYYCTIFTSTQVAQGSATVTLNGEYLKVHFRGQYGRVSNKKIKIE